MFNVLNVFVTLSYNFGWVEAREKIRLAEPQVQSKCPSRVGEVGATLWGPPSLTLNIKGWHELGEGRGGGEDRKGK